MDDRGPPLVGDARGAAVTKEPLALHRHDSAVASTTGGSGYRIIDRRAFVTGLGAVLAAPLVADAKQAGKTPRIGFLGLPSAASFDKQVDALRAGLRDLGYSEGKNIVIEYRWADGNYDRLSELAGELVRLRVDILVTHGTPGALAAKRASTTTPIVVATSADAVASGIVDSLARPGGNVTGLTYFIPELNAKRLEIVKESLPYTSRMGRSW